LHGAGYSGAVSLKATLLDNFAGDLEYHPRRAVVYFVLGTAAMCVWYFFPADANSSTTPVVFGSGSVTLFLKGVFLLRSPPKGSP
jgi:hypothetical protein